MPFNSAAKIAELSRASNPREAIIAAVGDLSGITPLYNEILVGTYIRPEKTTGGIIRPQRNVDEDSYQGKVGIVLKKGINAFQSDENFDFQGQDVTVGEYVVYRVGDGWALTINGVPCRMLRDRSVRLKITDPDVVY